MGAFTQGGKRRGLKVVGPLIGWAATNEEIICFTMATTPRGRSFQSGYTHAPTHTTSTVPSLAVMEEQRLEAIDTDLLIHEIQKRPAIWDMQSPDYKDRQLKKKCWEEITDIFCSSGEVKDKQLIGKLTK